MQRSSRILTVVGAVALAAIGVIALASEARSPQPSPAPATPSVAMPALAAATSALPAPRPGAPRVQSARLAEGDEGTTRVVIELDQAVEHYSAEMKDRPGITVRLLGAVADPVPSPIQPMDGRVERITFAPDGADMVMRVESSSAIRCRSFALHDPSRIVLDIDLPREHGSSAARSAALSHDGLPHPAEGPVVTSPVSVSPDPVSGDSDEPRFDDFLAWIEEFRREAHAVDASTSPEEKSTHWRALALLLAQRGLFDEADRTLTKALAAGADTSESYEDSLRLAEIRISAGHAQDAVAIARKLSPFGRSTEERIRLARVYADGGAPVAARAVLEELIPRVPAQARAETRLLLARCLWDSGAAARSLGELESLGREPGLARAVDVEATVLRADCLFALGRMDEARANYERAMRFDPGPEESAWIRLQLGHVAHRERRFEDAKTLYREASETWPDTFYATQAVWFLETADRLGTVWAKKEASGRG